MDDIGDQPTIIAWAFRGFEINQDQGAPPLAITQPMIELVGVPLDSRRSPSLHDVVKLLLEKGTELDSKDFEYSRTPLSRAAENRHEAVALKLR